jgi:tetratricopeptide (TPR) repeat protein
VFHHRRYSLLALTALTAICWSVSVRAQGTPGLSPSTVGSDRGTGGIRGRIFQKNGSSVGEAVKVYLLTLRGRMSTTFTDSQGQFEFRNLVPGEYHIEVEADSLKYETTTERVAVFRGSPAVVNIALIEKTRGVRSGDSVVSVGEMSAEVPGKARKEFDRATKLYREGRLTESIDHLKRAIEIHPKFLIARNDLGAQLLELGNLDEAATELKRAIEVDPKAFNPYLNLGIVLVKKREFAEAATALKTAVSLSSDSPAANLYLGIALMNLKDLPGAERHLKTAYDLGNSSYAIAFFYLGQVYVQTGDRPRAKNAFESYLRHEPTAANAPEARKLIGMLQQQ